MNTTLGLRVVCRAFPINYRREKPKHHYYLPSYKRICAEFEIDPSSDFRFTRRKNHGLGNVYVYAQGATKTEYDYPGWNKFSDEGGKAIKGNLIYYIGPDPVAATQCDFLARKNSLRPNASGPRAFERVN